MTVLIVLNFRGTDILNLKNDNEDHAFRVKNTLIFNAFVFCQVRAIVNIIFLRIMQPDRCEDEMLDCNYRYSMNLMLESQMRSTCSKGSLRIISLWE